jgi:fatty acid desaturase/peptidoglycan/LPS O-acetylase OafA/YrhL
MRVGFLAWQRLVIGLHLAVVAGAGWLLAGGHARPLAPLWAVASGVSLYVLTGLVHEASHRLLARSRLVNELAGNLAGWLILTPLTAYRAFHLRHHQATNRDGDPNAPLNSRWMLGVGSIAYVALIHRHAWTLRGRALFRYLIETAGMVVFLALLVWLLPRAVRERAWLLPMAVVVILQNIRIVTEHLDLPAGRYVDTWQLALPGWLSRWLLHNDHHLEHHLRPGLHWHELPAYRAELAARGPGLGLRRVTFGQFAREVFLRRGPASGATIAESHVAAPGSRLHGLDALRAGTMLLVVVLHAALAYATIPIPDLIWVARDPAARPGFDVLCWWTLGISSPFYLMSGFFAAEMVAARGLRGFVANRATRIAGPFLAAGLTVLPATFFVWVAGWLVSGWSSPREFLRMKFHAPGFQRNLYGPAHLWSLEYLAVMLLAYAAALTLWRPRSGPRRTAWFDRALLSSWRPVALAVPTTLILWAGHRYAGLDAMLDRRNSFIPEPFRLVHNAVFFVVGLALHRSRHELGRLVAHHWTYLALSIPVFVGRALLIRADLAKPLVGPAALAHAASGALFAWLTTFGLIGLALGIFGRPRPSVRYLADSSYWIYLVHLPVVGLLQIDLLPLALPAAAKFAIVLATTLALGLASYQAVVRHTALGRLLHGARDRRPAPPPGRAVAEPFPPRPLGALRGRQGAGKAPGASV